MTDGRIWAAGLLLAGIVLCGAGGAWAANEPRATLKPFGSEAELVRFLKKTRRTPPPPPAPPPAADGVAMTAAPSTTEPSAASKDDNITNTQEAGVDEGGIVKVRGDTLVILRRGRLFTVSTRYDNLRPVDSINAFPPGVDPRSDWYDEMLVAGNRVIVIGYSYGRGGTEINRFRIDTEGHLKFEDSYHLRSNDYYSSRNYASRLIGTKLVVYSPLYLPYNFQGADFDWMPGMRRWSGNPKAGFRRIVSANHIYVPERWRSGDDVEFDALHTVSSCDLTAPVLSCTAQSVLGPAGRTFYVSSHAVYVWVTAWQRRDGDRSSASLLYRLPLDGSAPSAVGVRGGPIDQFSFREDWREGALNVLVRSEGGGDAMWMPEFSGGAMALLRFPLTEFGDGRGEVASSRYRPLPSPGANAWTLQNRFVGEYLLYGAGNSWGAPKDRGGQLIVVPVRGGAVSDVALPHGIDRIEAMGRDAVVVGTDARDLHFRAVELSTGRRPELGDDYTLEGASQGETRSHAFFFKPEAGRTPDDVSAGVLALPVARSARPGYHQLAENSAAVIFLRRAARAFSPLGELGAREDGVKDDGCLASCVDWYGNARPIFLRDRTFALMGYELVEGEVGSDSIREVKRISFAPGATN